MVKLSEIFEASNGRFAIRERLGEDSEIGPFPRVSQPIAGRWPRIEVAGPHPRIGKTTAVWALTDEFVQTMGMRVDTSLEEWEENPYLTSSFNDGDAFGKSQSWFIRNKYRQVAQGGNGAVWIQDVPPEADAMYPLARVILGQISGSDYEEYRKIIANELDWCSLPRPDVLVYITGSQPVLRERVDKYSRPFETFSDDYLTVLRILNDAWVDEAEGQGWSVLRVNTDSLDFANVDKDKVVLLRAVVSTLRQQGWDLV